MNLLNPLDILESRDRTVSLSLGAGVAEPSIGRVAGTPAGACPWDDQKKYRTR
jgi:hypothetical protein